MLQKNKIPLMAPDIQDQDIEAVVAVLKSGMLVQGENVKKLEDSIADYLDVKHAVAVSNGTASLHLALIALGVGPGDEVIVPALSFMATANVVELVGATSIFVDIDEETFNINVEQIEEKITSKTKAIIPVHEFGLACDIEGVMKIAGKYDLHVIEDAACALGAKSNNRFVGTFGEVGSFSFHPRKAITGGEGGLIVTNNDELAKRFRILRNHGISVEANRMEFVEAGYNYRLTDIQAALILSQFQRLDKILLAKEKLANIYLDLLSGISFIHLPKASKDKRHTWQSFHITIQETVSRDLLINNLRDKGIGTNYGAQCIPFQSYYKEKYKLNCELLFPNAMNAYKCGLVLPLFERLSDRDITYASNILKEELNDCTL